MAVATPPKGITAGASVIGDLLFAMLENWPRAKKEERLSSTVVREMAPRPAGLAARESATVVAPGAKTPPMPMERGLVVSQ